MTEQQAREYLTKMNSGPLRKATTKEMNKMERALQVIQAADIARKDAQRTTGAIND